MIGLPLSDVIRATGGRLFGAAENAIIRGVVHDSREVRPGDLFVAIRGQRFDGHAFVRQAASRGACACLCDEAWASASPSGPTIPIVIVPDTAAAMGALSAYYRREVISRTTRVIAVTGSNGKTTTKHMIHHVLSGSRRGRCAPKSFNNQIGVPLTLLSVEKDDDYVVVEVGTNAPGEIAALSALVEPEAAVITSIGEAHLQGLGSVEAIAREKASVLDHLRPGGMGLVHADRVEMRTELSRSGRRSSIRTFGLDELCDLRVTHVRANLDGSTFVVDGRYEVSLTIPGVHHTTNAAAAFGVGRWMGLSESELIERLSSFKAVDGRTRRIELNGVTVIDDSYNANPSSMAAAIDTLAQVEGRRRVFVMGDMFELGERSDELHAEAVRRGAQTGLEVIVAVGMRSAEAARRLAASWVRTIFVPCDDADAAIESLSQLTVCGDVVWIKGSRGMQLDRVVKGLTARRWSHVAVA